MKTLHVTNPPMRGPDVRKVQTLLIAAGYKVAKDGVFGPATVAAVIDAKRRLGYPPAQRRPVAGERFVEKISSAKMPLVAPKHKTQKPTVRQRIVAYFKWGVANEPAIHYAQIRPIPVAHPRALPMRTDCSGFLTLAYKDAGAKDPNGSNDGLGYTGTMLAHGKPVTLAQAQPGDLVVFGAFPGVHVAGVIENDGKNPLLVSHGQESGPLVIRFSDERAYHASKGHGQFSFRSYL